jgi:hypothetical protein
MSFRLPIWSGKRPALQGAFKMANSQAVEVSPQQ